MRKSVVLIVLAIASLSLSACARGYQSSATPRNTLETFFTSAQKADYSTTYDCYDSQYKATVSEADFVGHRGRAAVLKTYHIDELSVSGDSANAVVSLTFAPVGGAGTSPHVTKVQERLVRESGGWRIAVR